MEAVTNVTLFLSSGAKGLGKSVLEQQGRCLQAFPWGECRGWLG